jgi:uncharacterized Zn finger protein
VADLQAKAEASVRQLEKKGRTLNPITIEGRTIARSWWGVAWVDNLERYADFSNRIGRGKKYVKAGCVIDLQVRRGKISAVVQGSRAAPYEVTIDIDPLPTDALDTMLTGTSVRAESLDALLEGNFPDELKDSLTARTNGIFPAPSEIHFRCSCPDSARICKHVAAAIMAVAPGLDRDPMLLFELRGVETEGLIARTVEQKLNLMLENADVETDRILDVDDDQLTALFGVL